MRLWADIYDASGALLGEGPITSLRNASVTRVLDGAGSIGFSVPLNDERAVRLLLNEVRARIFMEHDGVTREIGRGIVRSRQIQITESGLDLFCDGPDALDLLKRANTLLARIYPSQSVAAIATSLAGLASWTATTSGGVSDMTARYDGASVLKALQELAAHQGLHLRLGSLAASGLVNEVEVGAFGTSSGLRIIGPDRLSLEAYSNTTIALIETLTVVQNSEAVANWIVPLGQGEGEAALTLAKSTRTSPYPIQTTTVNGKVHYYLADTSSAALYGTIQEVAVFREIGAVSNSDADILNAANALYDAAAAWLVRNSVRLDTYTCTIRKVEQTLRPGDKVRLVYFGTATTPDGLPFTPVAIDADFWVMKAVERVGVEGRAVELTLASIDRVEQDAAELVIGALDDIVLQNTRIQTYPNIRSIPWRRELDSTHVAKVPVLLTDRTTALNKATVNFSTRPFRATAKTASAGGDHRHKMFTKNGASFGLPGGTTSCQYLASIDNAGSNFDSVFMVGGGFGSGNHEVWTNDASGTHTHPLTYGITDDTVYPDTISLYVDSIDRTSALGGPWGVGGVAAEVTVDITTYLVGAAGGLRQKHQVEFRCTGGQGEVEVTVEMVETIQAIA